MGSAIGASLPIAVGVLVSPMPIVAVVLMLVTKRARSNAFSFLLGWVVGVALVGTLVILLMGGAADSDDGGTPLWAAIVKIVLGVGLLLLALKQWRGRPKRGEEPPAPRWMAAIEGFTPPKAFGLAFLLGAINPKNLLLVVSGAAAIVSATSERSDQFVALAVFVVVATIGVAAPVVVYLAMGTRAGAVLDDLKHWMVQNNAAIMTVLLLVLGMKMIGDGIGAL
ncbi:conserved hypothetical protein [Beutenbergia cavernae DSM 12333]|uniref:Lysine exporter protein (LYSE/YGGA) n=1 Tax=Beutenbergia cavernae (strain ATCC BAA-8 / DSM 12333 / CCUG 43141 / JCM 11478 / NBRC 16432 / NCIMB 13614 / HKI 0122) TaxID=471853 RepID=C5BYR1_BEUC1|nr:GAP family protein [Beutenbergia cavernae]ACQ79019.1 conserved hypothetical protein [Beutenbergia cavernae DSM 12333]